MKAKSPIRYCTKLNLRNSFKRHRDISKRTVLKMLAVMENQQPSRPGSSHITDGTSSATTPENGDKSKEFQATGRTGRRNALPNILVGQLLDSSDLPKQFENLSTRDDNCKTAKDEPGPSKKSS